MEDNRFNLIDEEWIPVAGHGRASLRQVFSDGALKEIGGNPVEKIALFKLLLAIAQSACRPLPDDEAWEELRVEGMMACVQKYLNQHRDSFWLYGERPFLQMPAVEKAKKQPLGAVQLEVASGNTTVVTEFQQEKSLTDAEKAVLLVTLMGFACGRKNTDYSITLSKNYPKRSAHAPEKPTPSLGYQGFLHTFIQRGSIAETIYMNLFTDEQINDYFPNYPALGTAPWECMPTGEDDETARSLQKSYMGRLIPVSRFMLISKNEIHYIEGIRYPGYKEGIVDPTVAYKFKQQEITILWTNPNKRPWRELAALLSMAEEGNEFSCKQIMLSQSRLKKLEGNFQVWSGGVKVSNKSGTQIFAGDDDFVASCVTFPTDIYRKDSMFFSFLKDEMMELSDNREKPLKDSACGYFKTFKPKKSESNRKKDIFIERQVALMTNKFWQLCEGQFQNLIQACHENEEAERSRLLDKCHSLTKSFVVQIYDEFCPRETSRQLEAWAKNHPFFSAKEKEEELKDEYKTVAYVFRRCAEDTAFKAGLKKADNPDTEAQGWEYLADCGARLDRANERLAYATVLSAIAKSDRSTNGKLKLGQAIFVAYGSSVERASGRFRRLISCGDIPEFVRVLRPLLQYINSQGIALDYANLLNCLKQISASPDRAESIKAEWAQQFYSKASEQKEENE